MANASKAASSSARADCAALGLPRFAELTAGTFRNWPTLDAELVIFGSGDRIQFPPAWLAAA
jgi:uncharacterized protein